MEESNIQDCPNKRLRVSMDISSASQDQSDETGEIISAGESSREINLIDHTTRRATAVGAKVTYNSSIGLPEDYSKLKHGNECSQEKTSDNHRSVSDMGDGYGIADTTDILVNKQGERGAEIENHEVLGPGKIVREAEHSRSSGIHHACLDTNNPVTIHATGALAENLYIQRRETEKLNKNFNRPSVCFTGNKIENRLGNLVGNNTCPSISGEVGQYRSGSDLLRGKGASYFPLPGTCGDGAGRRREIHEEGDEETVELTDSGFIEMFSNSVMSRMISSGSMSFSQDSMSQSYTGHNLMNISETNMKNSEEDESKSRNNMTESAHLNIKPSASERLYLSHSNDCEVGDRGVNYSDNSNAFKSQHKPSFQILKTETQVLKEQEAMQVSVSEDSNKECFIRPPNELFQIDSDYLNNVVKQSGINVLPPNVLLHVFRYLSAHTLLRTASCVCKYWYNLSRDSTLWKEIILKNQHKLTDATLIQLIRFSDRISKVNLTDCRFVTDLGVQALVRRCNHLHTLILMRCFDITDKAFEGLQHQGLCPRLQALHLDGCCKISDKAIIEVSGACPMLRSLHLNQCNKISDTSIIRVADNCPWLQQLLLDHCDKVTDEGLSAVVRGCPNLSYLNIMSCGVTDTGVAQLGKLSYLTNLDLSNIPRLTTEAVVYVARLCQRLECINISLNSVMNDQCVGELARHLPNLKRLYCVSCCISDTGLEEIAKLRPTLEAIDVGWCQEVTDHGVRVISHACPKLDYFGLIRCDRVTLETIEELAVRFPRVNYSTFILESRKLLERARRDGYQFFLPNVR